MYTIRLRSSNYVVFSGIVDPKIRRFVVGGVALRNRAFFFLKWRKKEDSDIETMRRNRHIPAGVKMEELNEVESGGF